MYVHSKITLLLAMHIQLCFKDYVLRPLLTHLSWSKSTWYTDTSSMTWLYLVLTSHWLMPKEAIFSRYISQWIHLCHWLQQVFRLWNTHFNKLNSKYSSGALCQCCSIFASNETILFKYFLVPFGQTLLFQPLCFKTLGIISLSHPPILLIPS